MKGDESQRQNGFLKGDRTKSIHYDTGAIFPGKTARRVVTDDFEWFSKTLIAEGPHIAVWVNGNQVTDWMDCHKPDKIPVVGYERRRARS